MTRHALSLAASAWLAVVILAALFSPLLAPSDPIQPVGAALASPGNGVLFGTDELGRDLWSRMLFGARISLTAALLAALVTVSLGAILGLAAAMRGGWVERVILWGTNAMLAIPGLLLALMLMTALGPGVGTIILAVGIGGAPGFARLSRPVFLAARKADYAQAAHALGAGQPWVAARHVLPNALTPLLSLATTHVAWAFVGITTLTFLGLAGNPSLPEWGAMLNSGRAHLVDAPHIALWPGTAIALTVLSIQYLGGWITRRETKTASGADSSQAEDRNQS
jgi:peptide/nickel transport system permease protein